MEMHPIPRARVLATICVLALCASPARESHATMPPLSGVMPEAVSQAFAEGLFASSPSLEAAPQLQLQAQPYARWYIPVILVSFPDEALQYAPADFERSLFDTTGATTGSVFDYYRWVSGNRLTIGGRVVASVQVQNPETYYSGSSGGLRGSSPNNSLGLMRDVLRACADTIDWKPFDVDGNGVVDMVWLVHAGIGGEAGNLNNLWSVTTWMNRGWRDASPWYTKTPYPGGGTGQTIRIERFSVMPEQSAHVAGAQCEIGVYCHEFGHALGLPDLYSTSSFMSPSLGPGAWSLMGTGGYGGDALSPQYPTHLGAWPLKYLGWDESVHPSRDTVLSLPALGSSQATITWSYQGEDVSEYFLIEHRRRAGFDRNLPGEGLIIYHVDENVIAAGMASNSVNNDFRQGVQVVEADGDGDLVRGFSLGEASDPFPGSLNRTGMDDHSSPSTRTLDGAVSNLAIRDIQPVGDRIRFALQVRAPGWQPAEDLSGVLYAPFDTRANARQSVVDDRAWTHVVGVELRDGRLQIILRSGLGEPSEAFQVSHSTAIASDPAIALLPGNNLAIVWSDTRRGRPMLYYRSRIGGVWSDERLMVELTGSCSNPSIASDSRGTLSLAFRYTESNMSQVRFMRFTYYSPIGTSVAVTPMSTGHAQPLVLGLGGGSTMVMWSERSLAIPRLMFKRHHPDSGFSGTMPLTGPTPYEQAAFSAAVDSSATVYVVWQVSGPGINQIRYQRRPRLYPPTPGDSILVSQAEPVGRPIIDVGLDGTVHLAFEVTRSGLPQARYKRWTVEDGWDAFATEISSPDAALGQWPRPLPGPGGAATVVFTTFEQGVPRLQARRRLFAVPVADVGDGPAAPRTAHLTAGPNPLRAGRPLAMYWSGGGAPDALAVFDVTGRLVARIPRSDGARFTVDASTTGTWSSGVYFVRPEGGRAGSTRLVVVR